MNICLSEMFLKVEFNQLLKLAVSIQFKTKIYIYLSDLSMVDPSKSRIQTAAVPLYLVV